MPSKNSIHPLLTLKPAQVNIHTQTLKSLTFNDIYFNPSQAIEESQYVFLKHNQLAQRFTHLTNENFVISESGFGSGLNCLLAIDLFEKTAPHTAHLQLISYEKYPLLPSDLAKIQQNWPQLKPYSHFLQTHYPPLVQGTYTLTWPNPNIQLILIWGDINTNIQTRTDTVDAWFLDGFAPNKNPHMWQQKLFVHMARLSHSKTTIATFTAASNVRRGLEQAGFNMYKTKGFGNKREMLHGKLQPEHKPAYHLNNIIPAWYKLEATKRNQTLTVIGAGIAGCTTAYLFATRGWRVQLLDQAPAPMLAASGNRSAVIFTKLSPFDQAHNRFHNTAYHCALTHLHQLAPQLIQHKAYEACGLLSLLPDDQLKQWRKLLEHHFKNDTLIRIVNADQASHIAQVPLTQGGLFYSQSCWVWPQKLAQVLLTHPNITFLPQQNVTELLRDNALWSIINSNQTSIIQTETVILCNSFSVKNFPFCQYLPMKTLPGQLSYLPSNTHTQKLKTILSAEGYITPAINNQHILGATYRIHNHSTELTTTDHIDNLNKLKKYANSVYENLKTTPTNTMTGSIGIRCQTNDYLPVVGPIPKLQDYVHHYKELRTKKLTTHPKAASYLPGLFINTAHGSKGFTQAWLAAEILFAQLNNQPLPIDTSVYQAIHPARFIMRDLKRGKL